MATAAWMLALLALVASMSMTLGLIVPIPSSATALFSTSSSTPPGMFRVSVLGRPNAGKSTFVNSLVRVLTSSAPSSSPVSPPPPTFCLTHPKPQCTVSVQTVVLTTPRLQVALLDTPGVYESATRKPPTGRHAALNVPVLGASSRSIGRVLKESDAIILLVDASVPPPELKDVVQPKQSKAAAEDENEPFDYFQSLATPEAPDAATVLPKLLFSTPPPPPTPSIPPNYRRLLSALRLASAEGKPLLVLLNKSDLFLPHSSSPCSPPPSSLPVPPSPRVRSLLESYVLGPTSLFPSAVGALPISSTTDLNLDVVLRLMRLLPEDTAVDDGILPPAYRGSFGPFVKTSDGERTASSHLPPLQGWSSSPSDPSYLASLLSGPAPQSVSPDPPPAISVGTLSSESECYASALRGALLDNLSAEVPYACGVDVLGFSSSPSRLSRGCEEEGDEDRATDVTVEANIVVERDSHRRIVVGKGGGVLAKIGAAARRRMADMKPLKGGGRYHVRLRVVVRKM